MTRLFAGTPWDRPPRCERCDELESDCSCPPEVPKPIQIDPAKQTARIRVEKRPRGKVATAIRGLDPEGNDLPALLTKLKTACGGGGTIGNDGTLEVQGSHLDRVEKLLTEMRYRVKRN